MGFPWQKKDERRTEKEGKGKQSSRKWWGKTSGRIESEPPVSARSGLPGAGDRRRERGEANIHSFSGGPAPRHQTAHASSSQQDLDLSPAISRASTLSETDEQYLATQARIGNTRPRPEFEREAFAGTFEPVRQRPQTKYPIPPLTKEQLDALAGAYAPPAPAPPPRQPDKWGYK